MTCFHLHGTEMLDCCISIPAVAMKQPLVVQNVALQEVVDGLGELEDHRRELVSHCPWAKLQLRGRLLPVTSDLDESEDAPEHNLCVLDRAGPVFSTGVCTREQTLVTTPDIVEDTVRLASLQHGLAISEPCIPACNLVPRQRCHASDAIGYVPKKKVMCSKLFGQLENQITAPSCIVMPSRSPTAASVSPSANPTGGTDTKVAFALPLAGKAYLIHSLSLVYEEGDEENEVPGKI